jgi:hypothetical protein
MEHLMTEHIFEYKGRRITILINAGSDGQDNWGWSYTIESDEPIFCRIPRAPNAQAAIHKARRHAQRRIDGLSE